MYLHIGKDYVINKNNIIGIFNIETIGRSEEYNNFYESIKNDLIDISDENKKTIILVKDKNIKGYITNISSVTLKNRNL